MGSEAQKCIMETRSSSGRRQSCLGGRGLVFGGFGGVGGSGGVGVLLSVGGRWAGGGRTGRCVSGGFRALRQ